MTTFRKINFDAFHSKYGLCNYLVWNALTQQIIVKSCMQISYDNKCPLSSTGTDISAGTGIGTESGLDRC